MSKIDHTTIDTANRKYQNWVVNAIVTNWETQQFVCVDSPTGTGKSIMAMIAQFLESKHTSAANKILTSTKSLQRQYEKDFDIHLFMGARNYGCKTGEAEHYKAPGCGKRRCPAFFTCEYQVAKDTAMLETSVINYASAFNLPDLFADSEVIVFDEAHDAMQIITDCFTSTLTAATCMKAHSQWPDFKSITSVREKAAQLYAYAMTLPEDSDIRTDLVSFYAASINPDFLFSPGERLAKFAPKFVTRSMLDIVVQGKKCLFLSATLGGFSQFCKDLSIDTSEAAYIKVPSVFDPALTPHVWDFSVGRINAGNVDEMVPRMVESLDKIFEIHKGERGLIHVPSYKLCHKLVEEAGSKWKDRVRITDGNHYMEYDAFDDVILMSPSLHTGVSFNDDQARFNVIAKAPWRYLGDHWVQFRKDSDPGWYANEAKKHVHQAIGRTTRSPTDWSVIYFLDDSLRSLV